MNLNCVIIEDEHASQELLRLKLTEYFPQITVLKIIDNVSEAIDFLQSNSTDLVFLDNQLKGGFGIQILEKLKEFSFDIVFLTAHSNHTIEAFKYGATHYLLKPLITEDLIEAINRVFTKRKLEVPKEARKIIINSQNESVAINHNQITYLKSSGAYTEVNTINRKIIVSKNIGKLEFQLNSNDFIRVNHSYIVNKRHILTIKKGKNAFVVLSNEEEIPISQRRYGFVINQLE
jgi:two-component system LytT family response regulator